MVLIQESRFNAGRRRRFDRPEGQSNRETCADADDRPHHPPPTTAESRPKSQAWRPAAGKRSAWDPFHAQQDIDVGEFYMHKGDWTRPSRVSRTRSACADFAKPRDLTRRGLRKERRQRRSACATTRNICKCCRMPPTPRRSRRRSNSSPRNKFLTDLLIEPSVAAGTTLSRA